jgi:hypothetical protein
VRDDAVGHHVDVLLHLGVGELAADQALHRIERVLRIGDGLALGGRADHDFVVLERNHRRRRAVAFGVLDDTRGVALHDRHARVRRAEVDADDLAHFCTLPLSNSMRHVGRE